jgi:hypothetical protein
VIMFYTYVYGWDINVKNNINIWQRRLVFKGKKIKNK